jgi:uracil-DNA glycosylase
MKINERMACTNFPCADIDHNAHVIPPVDLDPQKIKVLMIAEAPPNDPGEYFYAAGNPFYLQTTVQAFWDAGAAVSSMRDIINLGVYITTAIKCGKTGYSVSPGTMNNCGKLLEAEVALFTKIRAFMLMGDVAIKMMNAAWKRQTGQRVIPAGPTYKLRGKPFYFEGRRVFPSYTPAGKNFLIEKSKRRMVAEDIREALALAAVDDLD